MLGHGPRLARPDESNRTRAAEVSGVRSSDANDPKATSVARGGFDRTFPVFLLDGTMLFHSLGCSLKPEFGVRGTMTVLLTGGARVKISLRAHRGTDRPAHLPLPQVPARQRKCICAGNVLRRRQFPYSKAKPEFHESVGGSGRWFQMLLGKAAASSLRIGRRTRTS